MRVIIGDAILYLGDGEELAPRLGCFDILAMDPPYEFRTSGGGKMRKERKCLEQIIEDDLDKGFDVRIINPLLYRSVFVFCHNDQIHKVLPHITGNYMRHVIIPWIKTNPLPVANKNYEASYEPYIHAWNEGGHPVGTLEDKKRYIITKNGGNSEFDHPTVKPLSVMEKIMRNANGHTVLDPYMGTGTTGIAALKHGKKFVGIEKRQKYFDMAVKRFQNYYCSLQSNV